MSLLYTIAYPVVLFCVFFSKAAATTEIYTLSLHDALPILPSHQLETALWLESDRMGHLLDILDKAQMDNQIDVEPRSEEHTSELQSRQYLVCRLLLEKKTNSVAV